MQPLEIQPHRPKTPPVASPTGSKVKSKLVPLVRHTNTHRSRPGNTFLPDDNARGIGMDFDLRTGAESGTGEICPAGEFGRSVGAKEKTRPGMMPRDGVRLRCREASIDFGGVDLYANFNTERKSFEHLRDVIFRQHQVVSSVAAGSSELWKRLEMHPDAADRVFAAELATAPMVLISVQPGDGGRGEEARKLRLWRTGCQGVI